MVNKETVTPPDRKAQERVALSAVLASPTFKKHPRLANLLDYICQKYFEGNAESIKEYSIAVDILHRPPSYDPTVDSIVRVEIYRLRKKLREFYNNEGAGANLEIHIATGRYLPEFVDRERTDQVETIQMEEESEPSDVELPAMTAEPNRLGGKHFALLGLAGMVCMCVLLLVWMNHRAQVTPASAGSSMQAAALAGPEVRIRCGYSKAMFKDQEGKEWSGDRNFSGGSAFELPYQPIARTREPQLFLSMRRGTFSYSIPLQPGTYELHLYFAETTYGPASQLGGGENSRVFDVLMNGAPLLKQFDVVSDAGANTADERVFKDVHPGPDGRLRLDFAPVLGMPMINAIEILPGIPNRLRPIRMVAQSNFVVDKSGNLWSPDTFAYGGQFSADLLEIRGADDAALYTGSRYGNFSYALPVDRGTYALTLYFAEKYWGTPASGSSGAGSRVFDVQCNGSTLLRNFDIAREAGTGVALKKTFHGLHPNAQGKLLVFLVPDLNYATVNALEVEDETP